MRRISTAVPSLRAQSVSPWAVALGLQLRKSPSISISGFGEGASDEGAFWEAMNYAGSCRLPILFVCENNRYATYSDQLKRQASDNICERVATFGVRATPIFGNDVAKVYRTLAHEVHADPRRRRSGAGRGLHLSLEQPRRSRG